MVLDSLDYLFYQAREKNNRAEMERIKKTSGPYYDDSRKKFSQLLEQEKERTKGTYFGLYLYYSYSFQNNTISSKDEIQNVRKYINSFDSESKSSRYYNLIEETLCRFEKCATGAPAPLFSGLTTKGKITSLKQFRGKYVLIDFWSSGCHWCRLETPNLLKTYNAFKNKKFTILGVSSDYKEQEWKKAIAEDKSFWDQILLPKKDIRSVMDKYCIVGIPHIILIDPQVIIIAKELRGDDIYNTVAKYIK
jgi:peroxiredoxin